MNVSLENILSFSLSLSVQVKVLITFNFFSQFIYLFNFCTNTFQNEKSVTDSSCEKQKTKQLDTQQKGFCEQSCCISL